MKTPSTTIRKLQLHPVPGLLFSFFALVTGYVLFEDVLHGTAITTAHVTSVAVLVATIAAGHYVLPQIKAGALVSALGLLIVFVAGTFYVVTSSGARNAETAANKKAEAVEIARQRGDLLKMKHEAEIILNACSVDTPKKYWGIRCGLRDAMTSECQSGKGSKCDGKAYSVTTYEAAVSGYDAKLDEIGPEKSANLYAHAAKVFAALPWVTADADAIEEALTLILPYVLVAVVEIATLVFGGMAITHTHSTAPAPTRTHSSEETAQTSFPDLTEVDPRWFQPDPTPPRGPRKSPPKLPENVVALRAHPVIRALEATGGSVSSNKELAELLGVSTGEASKMHQEVADQLDTERVGKELRISLRRRVAVA